MRFAIRLMKTRMCNTFQRVQYNSCTHLCTHLESTKNCEINYINSRNFTKGVCHARRPADRSVLAFAFVGRHFFPAAGNHSAAYLRMGATSSMVEVPGISLTDGKLVAVKLPALKPPQRRIVASVCSFMPNILVRCVKIDRLMEEKLCVKYI